VTPAVAIEEQEWTLPDPGRAAVLSSSSPNLRSSRSSWSRTCLHRQELMSPMPSEVLELPIWATICLLSSSITVGLAERALKADRVQQF